MLPCIYINHGGGPLPLMGSQPEIASFLRNYASSLPVLPTAILLLSAHWEEDVVAVHAGAEPWGHASSNRTSAAARYSDAIPESVHAESCMRALASLNVQQ